MKDIYKAMKFEHPDTIPVSLWCLPATWAKYRSDLSDIALRHPLLFPGHDKDSVNYDAKPESYKAGTFTDAWGCVWSNMYDGMESIVTGHPYPTRESVRNIKAPEIDIGTPHGFMFLRLFDLRGFEDLMIDFAEEPEELQMMIDTVLNYNLRQTEIMLKKNKSKLVSFGDDNGMQHSLPISPAMWRKYIKPCYMKIFMLCRNDDRYVYMHTDGCIYEVIPDFIECGVNIINPQFRANGLDNLIKTCKDKVCVDLDLDRQLFPFCSPADIDDHVREVVEKLGSPKGGLMLKAEAGPDVSLENIEAVCNTLEKYRLYYSNFR